MWELVAAAAVAIFIWWFSTGLVLFLDGLPEDTFAWSMLVTTLAVCVALAVIATTAETATPTGAYIAFVCAIVCWGWQEMTLYMGYITGPRREAAPASVSEWERLKLASETIIYHEIAILLGGLAIVMISAGGDNWVAAWTYMILWWMRVSAKINVFLGVSNHTIEFLPDNIAYLHTYFGKRPINVFFPISVTISTIITAWLIYQSVMAPAGSFEGTAFMLVGALMALAVLEHWLLVMPLPVAKLWGWGLASRA